MIVVVLLTIATGALLLWALYTEQVPPPPSRAHPVRWTGLPDAADIRRRDFPLALAGYDPDAVDAHLRAVSAAFVAVRDRLAATAVDLPPAHGDAPPGGAPPSDVVPTEDAAHVGPIAERVGEDPPAPPRPFGGPPASPRPRPDAPWAPPTSAVPEPDDRPAAPEDGSLGSISDD